MTDELLVALSMLLDDELPADQAAALRARIDAEPDVAEAWLSLQGLPAALGELPPEMTPPAALDAAVLSAVSVVAPRQTRRWAGLVAAAAAAAAVALVWPADDAAVITLVAGQQLVTGEATILAAEVPITVSGRADIVVEPQAGWTREPWQEEEGMVRMMFSMGAGVLVTVAVYEGAAIMSPPGGEPITVAAGEQHSVPVASSQPALLRERQRVRPAAKAGGVVSTELSEYIGELESENAALRLERDMQQGALQALEGEQQPWPDDVDPSYLPEAFTSSMGALAEGNPELDLVGVDCDEYPCLAMFRSYDEGDSWAQDVGAQLEDEWHSDERDTNMSVWASVSDTNGEQVKLLGVGVVGLDGADAEGIQQRSEWRMGGWLKDTAEDAAAQ